MTARDGPGAAPQAGPPGDSAARPPPAGVSSPAFPRPGLRADDGADPPGRDAAWPRQGLRLDGLAPRVVAYLSLALLPLGLIALYQTREYQQETEERAELSLLALTEQGTATVELALKEALGSARTLGVVSDLLGEPEVCSDYLGRFVGESGPYAFVGVLPPQGPVTCSSSAAPFELDDRDDWADLIENPRPAVRAREAGTASGEDVLIVAVPLPEEQAGAARDEGTSFVALSIPRARLAANPFGLPEMRPLRLVTFNAQGQVLTDFSAGAAEASMAQDFPPEHDFAAQASGKPRAFEAPSLGGDDRVYTVTPLVPGVAYAMAVWTPEQAGQGIGRLSEAPLLFPLLMWAVSLAVAFWAIHRLVIRRVTELGARMRRFGRDRSLPDRPPAPGTPYELREIDLAFRQMGESILQDEARMEHAFRERGVLLREVHHRVKNNLQLISSIISMQLRRLPEPRMRQILRRLQDRVLTLASIYRSLYTSPDMGDVNAAPVIRAIVEQELRAAESRVAATLDIEDLVLDPDKVVPLAFLAAEAVSNAVSRAGSAEGHPSLSVTFHRDGDCATLSIANSLASGPEPADPARGLGQHLIGAFAAQVGGPVEIDAGDRLYRLSVTFPIENEPAEVEPA